jgi:hypothetical protein
MVKFVPLFTAIVLISIFSISLLVGLIDFQLQNVTTEKITDDSKIQNLTTDFESSLNSIKSGAEKSNDEFTNSTVSTGGIIPFITAVSGIWGVFRNGISLVYNIVIVYIGTEILGSSPIIGYITGGILAIIIIVIISAIVYWVSRGEGG